jgi:phthalate 4,5-dioxygenase oxygenase subunit
MLSREENELITRVGPGTPMGALMREYWVPALVSSELPSADSDPVRVLLLGEQLIAFRDTEGRVGLIQNNCPHRGASLFFGRNEEAGLRCVYHGWKFDVDGTCIDMPNEPTESDFKSKVKAIAYPTQERGGIVWAYLGPRETPPPLPEVEANMLPHSAQGVAVNQLTCNWLQALEGDIDTIHAGLLHYGAMRVEDQPPGTFSEYQIKDRSAKFQVVDTEVGASYGAFRDGPPGQNYWRIAHFLFPFLTMSPPGVLGMNVSGIYWVPMDDEHTLSFGMQPNRQIGQMLPSGAGSTAGLPAIPNSPSHIPNSTDWYGRFLPVANATNDFQINRDLQRQNRGLAGYTGISAGIAIQDHAMTWGMGPIYDRTRERLGTTDAMVIRVRRRMLAAIHAHQTSGTVPPGVDNPHAYLMRSGGAFLPKGADWLEATRDLRTAFVEHPEIDPAIKGPL